MKQSLVICKESWGESREQFSCKASLLPTCEQQDLQINASLSIIIEQALKTDRQVSSFIQNLSCNTGSEPIKYFAKFYAASNFWTENWNPKQVHTENLWLGTRLSFTTRQRGVSEWSLSMTSPAVVWSETTTPSTSRGSTSSTALGWTSPG